MITNERQLRISRRKLHDLESHASESATVIAGDDPMSLVAASVEETIERLRQEIDAYEHLSSSHPSVLEIDDLGDLPTAAISARIAAGLTQAELAERIGVPEQSIQRYEQSRYDRVSFARLREIFLATGVRVVIH